MSKVVPFIKQHLNDKNDDPFMLFNVEDVIQRHHKWLELMPRVVPYYAVKANPFPLLLDILVALDLKFDCASQHEVKQILRRGGKPDDIIIANPSTSNTFLEYSKRNGVDLMVVDNVLELVKIESTFPEARIVIRIEVEGRYSALNLSNKYGADMETVGKILKTAKDMKMNVMGISFHVGSGCQSSRAYIEAIQRARVAFDMAKEMGVSLSLLDIGGGFPGSRLLYYTQLVEDRSDYEEMARDINKTLDQLFPEPNMVIIAEPGRYYSETPFTLVTKVISKRVIENNGGKTFMYYLNDGIFHTFFAFPYMDRIVRPLPFLNDPILCTRDVHFTILWGPTCTNVDAIKSDFLMPEMNIGEWIVFADMGTYSLTYSKFGFNGFPFPKFKVSLSEWAKNILIKTDKWPSIKQELNNILGMYSSARTQEFWPNTREKGEKRENIGEALEKAQKRQKNAICKQSSQSLQETEGRPQNSGQFSVDSNK